MSQPWYSYPVRQGFKWTPQDTHAHSGIDLATPYGTPITAPQSGDIISQGWQSWGGQINERVVDAFGNQEVYSFLHTSRLAPEEGHVAAGAPIGATGAPPPGAGFGSGAHLHFEQTMGALAPYMSSYNPWHPTADSYPVNPAGALRALNATGSTGGLNQSSGGGTNQDALISNPLDNLGGDIQAALDASATALKRAGVFLLALVGIGAAWWMLTHAPPGEQVTSTTTLTGTFGNLPVKAKASTTQHAPSGGAASAGAQGGGIMGKLQNMGNIGGGASAGQAAAPATPAAPPFINPIRSAVDRVRYGKAQGLGPQGKQAVQGAAFAQRGLLRAPRQAANMGPGPSGGGGGGSGGGASAGGGALSDAATLPLDVAEGA